MNNLSITALLGVILLAAGTVLNPANLAAQESAANKPSSNISDETIKKVVRANNRVGDVRREYAPRINDAQDPVEKRALIKEASSKMHQAIRETGLRLGQYKDIILKMRENEGLEERVMAELERQKASE